MPKDYAKRSTTYTRHNKSKKTKKSWKPFIFVIISLIMISFLGFHFYSYFKTHKHLGLSKSKVTQTTTQKPSPTPTPVVQDEPKFDFYTILPNEKASTSMRENTTKFWLIIKETQNFELADHLKNSLSLDGYETYIDKISKNNEVWFSIKIGPYSSKDEATKDQKKLLDQKFQAKLIRG